MRGRCPSLARNGHGAMFELSLLSGAKRKSHFGSIGSEFVKVFGCRPHEGGAARTGADVRKPPREETAGSRTRWRVRRYGDFGAASER